METYFLKKDDILRFYERISVDFQLFVPVRTQSPLKQKCDYQFNLPTDDYLLKKYPEVNKEEIVFNDYRCIEPTARAFYTHFKEEICAYSKNEEAQARKEKPVAVCGVKNCDLYSAKIQDFVFLGGNEEDSVYKARRESTLIISGDCLGFKEVCFCRAFEINPHPDEGFDFNLTPLTEGYLLDVATIRAKDIVASLKDILVPATAVQISARSSKRQILIKRLEEHLSHHRIPKKEVLQEIVLSGYNSQIWQEQMRPCVECAGCIFICDTCHCFLLSDELQGGNAKKLRIWDGCLLKDFTRVAGGANPLKMRYMRLRNRFLKKFDFFIVNLGLAACCGCGRCIEVCPGKIDIRYILRRLYEEKYLPAS